MWDISGVYYYPPLRSRSRDPAKVPLEQPGKVFNPVTWNIGYRRLENRAHMSTWDDPLVVVPLFSGLIVSVFAAIRLSRCTRIQCGCIEVERCLSDTGRKPDPVPPKLDG